MFNKTGFGALALALVLAGASGCSSQKSAIYEHENFDDSGTFSRSYPVSESTSCEAARRALLSQGYIITSSDPKLVSGHKSFQQTGESHMEISFNVVCAADGSDEHRSTIFANALQDRYALKKVNNSASVGVGVLGSVSMPIGSSDDSMVKVASETVAASKFYERYFALVESFLPADAKKAAHIPDKPKSDLGVPEPTPAAAPLAPAAKAEAKPEAAPGADEGSMSQPVTPPAEPEPISAQAPAAPAAEQNVPVESSETPAVTEAKP
ncbi:DUF2242 domain-containing protein [Pseudomonas akapageensis]|uniref:DUF2242 domain-containing protein n=1 Tax=Pseudomonas akapageensis TaxID=2609961 RepID=UPI001408D7C9|nr:DUF2242 domain-containing protein [Pseudomonas akapageensis]